MSLEQLLASIPPGSPDETLARQVNFEQLPAHIAIIMDGNGRWAATLALKVTRHRLGRDVVETSARLGIDVPTRTFSVGTKRPRAEVTVDDAAQAYIRSELARCCETTSASTSSPGGGLAPDVQQARDRHRQTANTGCSSTSR
jgi:undecaprenyl pyrophosphate synthase